MKKSELATCRSQLLLLYQSMMQDFNKRGLLIKRDRLIVAASTIDDLLSYLEQAKPTKEE